jgi:hypothetical protein
LEAEVRRLREENKKLKEVIYGLQVGGEEKLQWWKDQNERLLKLYEGLKENADAKASYYSETLDKVRETLTVVLSVVERKD